MVKRRGERRSSQEAVNPNSKLEATMLTGTMAWVFSAAICGGYGLMLVWLHRRSVRRANHEQMLDRLYSVCR